MKLKDIILITSFSDIKTKLLELYPDQLDIIDEYEVVFEKLLILDPKPTDVKLHITNVFDDYDQTEYTDVSGVKAGEEMYYALEFTEWPEWLDMVVTDETLETYSYDEIVAHSLYEMTFISFDENDIKIKDDEIKNMVDEIKNMTEQEKLDNFTSIDEVLKKLKEQENNENE